MKFPSCFSHVMLLVFSLTAPQILGAQSKTAAAPATKPGVVKTSLTAQPGQVVTPVVQYYTDNDALPVSDEISRVDLEETSLKGVSEVNDLIATERAAISQVTSSPDFDFHKMPTYQAYDRILSYVQQAVAELEPITQATEKSYQRVLKEAETDANLIGMDNQVLDTFYNTFVQNLKSN